MKCKTCGKTFPDFMKTEFADHEANCKYIPPTCTGQEPECETCIEKLSQIEGLIDCDSPSKARELVIDLMESLKTTCTGQEPICKTCKHLSETHSDWCYFFRTTNHKKATDCGAYSPTDTGHEPSDVAEFVTITEQFHKTLDDKTGFFIRTFGDKTAEKINIILENADEQIAQLQVDVICKDNMWKEWCEKAAQLQKQVEGLEKALVDDSPFPLLSCLSILHGAAVHLITEHNCDVAGHERIIIAYQKVPELMRRIKQALTEQAKE